MKKIFLFLLFCHQLAPSQNTYPQNYFRNPLDVPLILSGSFAELRANHFHSGLDIKTQQQEGLNVFACADGFVSRIKIQERGYGKALYITHPNGYTTVYAHLQKFSPKIESYIKQHQYGQESYEIEVFPGAVELLVKQGEVVAYSGNTGGSEGPHLHFEIRDNQERTVNPLFFGIDVKDTTKPIIKEIYAYPISKDAHVNKSNEFQKLRLQPLQNGDYSLETITAYGTIGFGIVSSDRQDLGANRNGVYNIQTSFNGQQNFEIEFSRFSFDETSHLNRYIDYKVYKTTKERIQKLFIEKNNPLSIYKKNETNGFIEITDSTTSVYKIKVTDFNGNACWLTLNIKGLKTDDIKRTKTETTDYYITCDQPTTLQKDNVTVTIPANTFYDDFYTDFDVHSDTLILNKDIYPMRKPMTITYDVTQYSEQDRNQLYVAELVGYKKYPYYTNTKLEGTNLIGTTKYLGSYALIKDSVAPTIKPYNFTDGKWLSKYHYLQVKIDDNESGISNYRATINGKWILMEYEYKKSMLTYDFSDGVVKDTENNLKIIVTDNVGNSTTFETTFFRK